MTTKHFQHMSVGCQMDWLHEWNECMKWFKRIDQKKNHACVGFTEK